VLRRPGACFIGMDHRARRHVSVDGGDGGNFAGGNGGQRLPAPVDGWPDPRLAGARRLTVCSDVGLSRFDGSGGVSEIDGVMGVALVATRAPINTAAG
jgi:hypothetical protein